MSEHRAPPPARLRSSPWPLPAPDSSDQSLIVLCRICEQYVPLSLMEEHSNSCAQAFQAQVNIITTDERISRLIGAINNSVLNHPWPGDSSRVISISLPLLHAVLILQKALTIDPSKPESAEELNIFLHNIQIIPCLANDANANALLARAQALLDEKINACNSLSEASIIQKNTRIAKEAKRHIVTIADFHFIKRISSGAYARVFLGKKDKTGDIFAIKIAFNNFLTLPLKF